MQRELHETPHTDLAEALNNLGFLLGEVGEYQESENLFREVLEMKRFLLGDSHTEIALDLNNIAFALYDQKKYAEAEVTECGSSRMRVRGASYFDIGFHIDFGLGFEWLTNSAGNFESFVSPERYKLVLLEQSVKNARAVNGIGRFTNFLLRFNVARAIKRLDQDRYHASLFYIRAFKWVAENFRYNDVPDENFNGDHIMRISNAELTMRVKTIPYAGP